MPDTSMKLLYEGSVKTVYQDTADPTVNYFEYTDDYSIFDWGKMPDKIAYKGKALSILGGTLFNQLSQPKSWTGLKDTDTLNRFRPDFRERLFTSSTYQQLCQAGLQHHFLGWVNGNGQSVLPDSVKSLPMAPLMKVHSINIVRPQPFTVDQHTLYRYDSPQACCPTGEAPFLVPLEVIFRFGMPEGSSLEKRLAKNPSYAAELGLTVPPQQNVWFERPVLEFFTKLEPTDRFLSIQEAFLISGLSQEAFGALYEKTLLLSLWLFDYFAQRDIELWDGKFEFAWSSKGLLLVDSIGPDELRLKHKGVHLSKEVIRQFYRDTSWEKAVKEAKARSQSQPGSDWKAICQQQLGETPKPLSPQEKLLVDNLYGTLINHCLGESVIATSMPFDKLIDALRQEQPLGVR